MFNVEYFNTDKNNEMFNELCFQLNSELSQALSGPVNPIVTRANNTDDFSDVIIAVENNIPIGCIALRPFSADTAEIKRMYVIPQKRAAGIGKILLEKCLSLAKKSGYQYAVLETNEKLPIAKSLYINAGFAKMPSYGPYAALEETLCMKKKL